MEMWSVLSYVSEFGKVAVTSAENGILEPIQY